MEKDILDSYAPECLTPSGRQLKPFHPTSKKRSPIAFPPSPPNLPASSVSDLPPPIKIAKKAPSTTSLPNRKLSIADVPSNPMNIQVLDKDGNTLNPGDPEFCRYFAKQGKRKEKTNAQYNSEWKRMMVVLKAHYGDEKVNGMLASELPVQEVGEMISYHIASRINLAKFYKSGEKQYLDTTTLELLWAKISAVMRDKTDYDLSKPEFQAARNTKCAYMRKAKLVPGLGELASQPMPLSRAQLSFLLYSDQLCFSTPWGLTWLFYIQFTIYFLPRVKEEVWNARRGDFRRVFNPDGSLKGIIYAPMGSLKRDQGNKTALKSAGAFKRPCVLPCVTEPKLCFARALDEMEKQLDMMPWEGDRKLQRIFHQVVAGQPAPGKPFYVSNKHMGGDKFDSILRTAIWAVGIKCDRLQIVNQALRPTAFCLHKFVGLTVEDMMAVAGHCSRNTHTIYTRGNIDLMLNIGSKVQEGVTGQKFSFPDTQLVEMIDGSYRRVKDMLPYVDKDDVSHTRGFPLAVIQQDEVVTTLGEDVNEEVAVGEAVGEVVGEVVTKNVGEVLGENVQ